MEERAPTDVPLSVEEREDDFPAMRKTGRFLLAALAIFVVLYYPAVTLAEHTLIPFFGLLFVGLLLGSALPGRRFWPCFVAWWLVFMASVLRRSALADMPLASQIFEGALLAYPAWAVWLAEALRLGVYFWALWLGAGLGRRIRGRAAGGALR